jgi:hypothetical protein
MHNAIAKTLGVLIGLWGLVQLIEGLDRPGFWAKLFWIVWGVLVVVTAVGFFRMRGWAFLCVSVGLLGNFFVTLVTLLVAIDRREGVKEKAFWFVVAIALIGYLGRWSIERRFRPHLDTH